MIKYLIAIIAVLGLLMALQDDAATIDIAIITPAYRATPHETPLASGFNEVVNAQIDNVDAIATAISPVFNFWDSSARATPGNVSYGAEGSFGLVSVVATGTPTPGNTLWAGVVFDDYFEWYSAFESGSYWTMNLYDAHTEPRVTCIKVIPTAGIVEIFGTPLVEDLHINQSTPQSVTGGMPIFSEGIKNGDDFTAPAKSFFSISENDSYGLYLDTVGDHTIGHYWSRSGVQEAEIEFDTASKQFEIATINDYSLWLRTGGANRIMIDDTGVIEFIDFAEGYLYVNGDTELESRTPAPTPTFVPTLAPPTAAPTPTPEIPAWGTATPVAGAGDVRWNADFQLLEGYDGTNWLPLQSDQIAWVATRNGAATIMGDVNDTTWSTTWYAPGNLVIFGIDFSLIEAPTGSDTWTATASVAGTPIPGLSAEIAINENSERDYCTYKAVAKKDAVTVDIAKVGTPTGSQMYINLYYARRP